jgi:DNA-binding MarR family transcriptional regulator
MPNQATFVELGLLDEEREAEGRRRRVYTLTAAGRKALDDWLREPTSEQPQIRDTGLLKLFFGDGLSADEVAELARAQEEAHRRRLAAYEAIEDTVTNPNHAGRRACRTPARADIRRVLARDLLYSTVTSSPDCAAGRR